MIRAHFNMKLSIGISAVPETSLDIDRKESFHEYWKILLHYAFITPHWGGKEKLNYLSQTSLILLSILSHISNRIFL